jgi:DNA polymerase elongation subunit (family B)
MLADLTTRRLEAKAKAKAGGPDAAYWDGLQSSFKILINSFYGNLGAPFQFNDYRAASQVTLRGQELVKQVAEELERTGSRVIEIDTDGVYFVPPAGVADEPAEQAYVERIGSVLPEGIRLAFDGRYAAMVSLKVKNYVLVDYQGKKTVKGASLRSRADEAFGRTFLQDAIEHLFADEPEQIGADYAELTRKITHGELPLEQFTRRERVTEKTFQSEAKRRSREVARDNRVGDTLTVYQKADGSLGLVNEYAGDEDRWYYLDKLYRFAQRLQDALGEEFTRLCPKPVKKRVQAEQAGQLSLF